MPTRIRLGRPHAVGLEQPRPADGLAVEAEVTRVVQRDARDREEQHERDQRRARPAVIATKTAVAVEAVQPAVAVSP